MPSRLFLFSCRRVGHQRNKSCDECLPPFLSPLLLAGKMGNTAGQPESLPPPPLPFIPASHSRKRSVEEGEAKQTCRSSSPPFPFPYLYDYSSNRSLITASAIVGDSFLSFSPLLSTGIESTLDRTLQLSRRTELRGFPPFFLFPSFSVMMRPVGFPLSLFPCHPWRIGAHDVTQPSGMHLVARPNSRREKGPFLPPPLGGVRRPSCDLVRILSFLFFAAFIKGLLSTDP